MKVLVTIPMDEYNRLQAHSQMLGRIASVVSRYARTPETTTYECVVKLDQRERELSKTLKKLKQERK